MELEILNNLKNASAKNVEVDELVEELKKHIDESIDKKLTNEEEILKQIQNQRNTSTISKNTMISKMNEILKEYSSLTQDKGEMYFVRSKKDTTYTVYKYEDGQKSIIKLDKTELPEGADVNSILRTKDENLTVDEEDTKNIEEQITQMANEILDKQDQELEEFRSEGHIYLVEEDRIDKIYLTDITNGTAGKVLEEVDFPEELLKQATEGSVFIYQNGEYSFYSQNGYEMIQTEQ